MADQGLKTFLVNHCIHHECYQKMPRRDQPPNEEFKSTSATSEAVHPDNTQSNGLPTVNGADSRENHDRTLSNGDTRMTAYSNGCGSKVNPRELIEFGPGGLPLSSDERILEIPEKVPFQAAVRIQETTCILATMAKTVCGEFASVDQGVSSALAPMQTAVLIHESISTVETAAGKAREISDDFKTSSDSTVLSGNAKYSGSGCNGNTRLGEQSHSPFLPTTSVSTDCDSTATIELAKVESFPLSSKPTGTPCSSVILSIPTGTYGATDQGNNTDSIPKNNTSPSGQIMSCRSRKSNSESSKDTPSETKVYPDVDNPTMDSNASEVLARIVELDSQMALAKSHNISAHHFLSMSTDKKVLANCTEVPTPKPIDKQSVEQSVPENNITPTTTRITSDMLPLIDLTQCDIDIIVKQIEGGVTNIQDIYALSPIQEEGDRHDILRTAAVWEGLSTPAQVVLREAKLSVTELSLSPADGPIVEQLMKRYDPHGYSIDLTKAPWIRF
ncbi:hypothetical protein BGX26_000867 [Mortierella sp. AD094]|nr:hypothetical protein BGX26_000867 [Mortierella sp. AD094]